jgi:hypothetical protein
MARIPQQKQPRQRNEKTRETQEHFGMPTQMILLTILSKTQVETFT